MNTRLLLLSVIIGFSCISSAYAQDLADLEKCGLETGKRALGLANGINRLKNISRKHQDKKPLSSDEILEVFRNVRSKCLYGSDSHLSEEKKEQAIKSGFDRAIVEKKLSQAGDTAPQAPSAPNVQPLANNPT